MARRRGSEAHPRAGTTGFEQRVLDRYRRLRLSTLGPIVVGFSGGPDSLALASCLARLRPWLERAVSVVHVDHGLRPSSGEEATRARALAERLDLPFQMIAISSDRLHSHVGVGVEEAARRERYLALAGAAEAIGASLVATGHHQQDQAETILLHLLRGSGLSGAAGMTETAERVIPWWTDQSSAKHQITIWRPLLDEPRAAVLDYLAGVGIEPILDASNADPAFRRNVVRHTVLPCLERAFPGAVAALARFGRLAAEDNAVLEVLAETALEEARDGDGLDVAAVQAQHPAVQRRLIRRWLNDAEPGVELTAERIEAVRRLAAGTRGGTRVEVGHGRGVARIGGRLFVPAIDSASSEIDEYEFNGA